MKKVDLNKYTLFQQKVFRVVMKIPAGKVLTYGEVARRIGKPNAARAVGHALSMNEDAPTIPCHRVIGANGKMVGYSGKNGIKGKLTMLKREGYKF
jgi:methylated-DNA-[protein]-cysteine S-methyltransferase